MNDLLDLGVSEVYELSLQTTDHQRDARNRIKPPYESLSDTDHEFTNHLRLPTFEVKGETFNKRLTLVLFDGMIEHMLYPVFPPDIHVEEVVRWLEANPVQ